MTRDSPVAHVEFRHDVEPIDLAQSTRSRSRPISIRLRPPGVSRSSIANCSLSGRPRLRLHRQRLRHSLRGRCASSFSLQFELDRLQQPLDNRAGRQDVFARFVAVGAGAQNVDPRLIFNRRDDRREVHERADNDALRQPRMVQRPRAVGRGDEHAPPADGFAACTRAANCRGRSPSIRSPLPLAAQHDVRRGRLSPPRPALRRSPETARPPSPRRRAPGRSSTSPAAGRSRRRRCRPSSCSVDMLRQVVNVQDC